VVSFPYIGWLCSHFCEISSMFPPRILPANGIRALIWELWLLHLSWPKLLIPHNILVHLIMLVLSNIWFVLLVHNKRDKFLVIGQKQWMILTKLVLEDAILIMFAVIVERQDMWLIHAIEVIWLGHVSNKSLDVIKNKFLLLNIINISFVIFVILQSKKNFPFLLAHLNLKNVLIWFMLMCGDHTLLHQFMVINIFWP